MEDMTNNKKEKNAERRTRNTALRFTSELMTKLKQTVIHAQRHDPSVTLTSTVERGVELVIRELDKKYGEAPKLKDADVKLRVGRRLTA